MQVQIGKDCINTNLVNTHLVDNVSGIGKHKGKVVHGLRFDDMYIETEYPVYYEYGYESELKAKVAYDYIMKSLKEGKSFLDVSESEVDRLFKED